MRAIRPCLFLLVATSTGAIAQALDGSVPIECKVTSGYDCLPGQANCGKIKPESSTDPVYTINVAAKEVKSPFRTTMLKIAHTTSTADSIVAQGADNNVAWSAVIRKTGEMTLSVADKKGGYVAFGQCKVAAAK